MPRNTILLGIGGGEKRLRKMLADKFSGTIHWLPAMAPSADDLPSADILFIDPAMKCEDRVGVLAAIPDRCQGRRQPAKLLPLTAENMRRAVYFDFGRVIILPGPRDTWPLERALKAAELPSEDPEREMRIFFRTIPEVYLIADMLAATLPLSDSAIGGMIELMINAVEHGNLEIGYDLKHDLLRQGRYPDEVARRLAAPAYRARHVELIVSLRADSALLTVADDGPGFDRSVYTDKRMNNYRGPSGRGLLIAEKAGFRDMRYKGDRVEVVADLTAHQADVTRDSA